MLSQIGNLLIPVIMTPYLARVFGVKGLGINAYVITVSQYFIVFAGFGMISFGTRTIAFYRSLQFSEHVIFSNLAYIQFIATLISGIVYFFTILFFFPTNTNLYYFSMIAVLSTAFDYSWYFIGTNQMKRIAWRNLFVKITGSVLILLFVNNIHQIGLYFVINSLCIFGGNVITLKYLPRNFRKLLISKRIIKKQIFPSLKLFLPQLAMLVYASFDKILLGSTIDKYFLGIYDSSMRIIIAISTLTVSLSPIMVSKVSNLSRNNNAELIENYTRRSLTFTCYFSVPLALGLAATAPVFIPWFLTDRFEAAVSTILILILQHS